MEYYVVTRGVELIVPKVFPRNKIVKQTPSHSELTHFRFGVIIEGPNLDVEGGFELSLFQYRKEVAQSMS